MKYESGSSSLNIHQTGDNYPNGDLVSFHDDNDAEDDGDFIKRCTLQSPTKPKIKPKAVQTHREERPTCD